MPILNFTLKNNDGTKIFINTDLDLFASNSIQIINNGFTGFYIGILNEKSDDVIYDSTAGTLTLPIKIKGLSKTINATEPDSDYTVGKSFFLPSSSSNIYYTVEDDSTPTYSFKHLYSGKNIGTGPIKFKSYTQTKPSTGETYLLNDTLALSTQTFIVVFSSNKQKFNTIKITGTQLFYDSMVVYNEFSPENIHWSNGEAYRTITFEEAVTDSELLSWLEANGVKRGGNITLPEVENILDFENITYSAGNFTGTPTFSSSLNNARLINVGAKGYELLSKANNINVETSLSDLINSFNITKTNKDSDFISTDWLLGTIFEYRLTDESGNNGGTLTVWGAKYQNLQSLIADDILILKYNAIDDTLTVCELDSFDGSTGEFTVSEEVGYYDVLAIALKN